MLHRRDESPFDLSAGFDPQLQAWGVAAHDHIAETTGF
jgi:hypothetical protein